MSYEKWRSEVFIVTMRKKTLKKIIRKELKRAMAVDMNKVNKAVRKRIKAITSS